MEKDVLHKRLLEEIRATPGQRVGWYAARLRVEARDASTALVELRKLGVVQLHGHKNAGKYYPDGLPLPKEEGEPETSYPREYSANGEGADMVGELARIDELLDTFRVPLLPTRIARLAFLAGLSRSKA